MGYTYTRVNKYLKGDLKNVVGSGRCQRSNFMVNHDKLIYQMEYNSKGIYNTGILVYEGFADEPNPQNLAYDWNLYRDPEPIKNPSPRIIDFNENE